MRDRISSILTTSIRVIVCTDCKEVVAEDDGGPFGRVMVTMGIESHINHPQSRITEGLQHNFQTRDTRTNITYDGVELNSDLVQ